MYAHDAGTTGVGKYLRSIKEARWKRTRREIVNMLHGQYGVCSSKTQSNDREKWPITAENSKLTYLRVLRALRDLYTEMAY